MDFGLIHIIWTILLILIFLGISYWAFHKTNNARFDQASQLPFVDDADDAPLDSKPKVINTNKAGVKP